MDVQTLVGSSGSAQAAPAAHTATTAAVAAPSTSSTASSTPISSTQPAANEFHVLGGGPTSKPGIAPAIAKIFGSESDPTQVALNVSYKVENHQILTVFSDPATGQEIAQFPPDLLAHVASFFDQQQGVTLDQNA